MRLHLAERGQSSAKLANLSTRSHVGLNDDVMIGGFIVGGTLTDTGRYVVRAPSSSRESALILSVGPGNYTAIVRGAGNATGVGLVEVL